MCAYGNCYLSLLYLEMTDNSYNAGWKEKQHFFSFRGYVIENSWSPLCSIQVRFDVFYGSMEGDMLSGPIRLHKRDEMKQRNKEVKPKSEE